MTETRPSWLLPPVDSLTEFPTQQIARQLSRICRYAGSTPRFYSVGRHSLLVAELVPHDPALRLAALVHDAHECWTGDLCRPAKQVTGSALDRLTRQYDDKLHALLGLDLSIADREIVRMADDAACKLEMAWLDKTVDEILTARPNRGLQNVHLAYNWSLAADEGDWRRAVEGVLSEVGRVR
jgi:hypothetical protein